MLSEDRHEHIVRAVAEAGFVRATDLARTLGISRATAWRDIDKLARDGVVAKVHGGAAALREAKSERATRMSKHQLTIGMQVPTNSYYYRSVIDGAREAAGAFGARLVVGVSGYEGIESDLEATRGLVAVGVDGLLVTPSFDRGDAMLSTRALLAEFEPPIVLVERELIGIVGSDRASVSSSRDAGVVAAVDHLHSQGHRRIGMAFIERSQRSATRNARHLDLAQTVLGLDHPARASWIWHGHAEGSVEGMLTSVRDAGVTALVMLGDPFAVRISHEAQRLGLRVPEDLSIVSYDDEVAADAIPPLTAVAPDRRGVGRLAARLLLTHLSGGEPLGGRRLMLEPTLSLRDSVAELDVTDES